VDRICICTTERSWLYRMETFLATRYESFSEESAIFSIALHSLWVKSKRLSECEESQEGTTRRGPWLRSKSLAECADTASRSCRHSVTGLIHLCRYSYFVPLILRPTIICMGCKLHVWHP
jgi:hypothetical protein